MTIKLPLSAVKIGDRVRKEYNDIEELALSILTQGMIHPPTIDKDYNLIAGGRRMQALLFISKGDDAQPHDFESEFNIMEGEVTPSRLKRLEIEENSQRQDITWLEKCLGIAEYHKICGFDAKQAGDKWSQDKTSELLKVNQSTVSFATVLGALYKKDPKNKIFEAETMDEAVRLLAVEKLDKATQARLKAQQATRKALDKADAGTALKGSTMTLLAGLKRESAPTTQDTPTSTSTGPAALVTEKKELISYDEIVKFYRIGNCLEVLPKIKAATTIHHIVCDPPYALEMETIYKMQKADRVKEEHQVEPNLKLIKDFLTVAYDTVDRAGFVCLWYAPEQYQLIVEHADWLGFKVCLWPFVWCKSSQCQNRAAQYNITKATEFCLLLRRSESSIIAKKQMKNYLECPSVTSVTHPFVKPFLVWQYLIETVSHEGQTIVDPFAGEGSSLSAMFKLNRTPIGVEMIEQHAANGMSYLHEELNKIDVLSGGNPWK